MMLKHYEHGQDIQTLEDTRKVVTKCSFCKCDIKTENEDFYGDEAYYDHGIWACGDCKDKFLAQYRVGKDFL